MKEAFVKELKQRMLEDERIYVLLGGVGYGMWTKSKHVINCEASEQAMVDMAVGLALQNKLPFVYAITPHLYRAFESLRLYLQHEKIPVKLVGIGQKKEYGNLGFTHWANDAKTIFRTLPNICTHYGKYNLDHLLDSEQPEFVNLSR